MDTICHCSFVINVYCNQFLIEPVTITSLLIGNFPFLPSQDNSVIVLNAKNASLFCKQLVGLFELFRDKSSPDLLLQVTLPCCFCHTDCSIPLENAIYSRYTLRQCQCLFSLIHQFVLCKSFTFESIYICVQK